MKYQIVMRKGSVSRVEYYFGIIVDLETRKTVHFSSAMSEAGLTQILENKLRRILNDDAKSQKIEFISSTAEVRQ